MRKYLDIMPPDLLTPGELAERNEKDSCPVEPDKSTDQKRVRSIADSFMRTMRKYFATAVRTSPETKIYYDRDGVETGRVVVLGMRHGSGIRRASTPVRRDNGDY